MLIETNSFPSSRNLQQDDRRSNIPTTGRQSRSATRAPTCMMSLVIFIKANVMTKSTTGSHFPPFYSVPTRRLDFDSWGVKRRVQLQFRKAYARLPTVEVLLLLVANFAGWREREFIEKAFCGKIIGECPQGIHVEASNPLPPCHFLCGTI